MNFYTGMLVGVLICVAVFVTLVHLDMRSRSGAGDTANSVVSDDTVIGYSDGKAVTRGDITALLTALALPVPNARVTYHETSEHTAMLWAVKCWDRRGASQLRCGWGETIEDAVNELNREYHRVEITL